jgi:predicted component of type VI protein secretion system
MLFRDELVEEMQQIAELRIADLLTDDEFLGRMEDLLHKYRIAHGYPAHVQSHPPTSSASMQLSEDPFTIHPTTQPHIATLPPEHEHNSISSDTPYPASSASDTPHPTSGSSEQTVQAPHLLSLIIASPDGEKQSQSFDKREITIGRSSDSDLVLRRTDISRRHARLLLRDGCLILLDLKSENGTHVNGKRLGSPQVVNFGDTISVGDYKIFIESIGEQKR